MNSVYTASIRVFAVVGVAASVYFAVTVPLSAPEATIWVHLIRPSLQESIRAADAWKSLFYAVLAERAIGLFRLSELSLRLPAILSGLACAVILWRSPRLVLAAAYAGAVAVGWFSTAQGHGLAMAFCFAAFAWPAIAGWLLGGAIAASPAFSVLLLVYCRRIKEIERVVIPAVATAFMLLLIPASHAGAIPEADTRPEFYRERDRRNAASGGGFQPPAAPKKPL